MDASTVRSWLVSTADADADVRRRAELELKKVSGGLIAVVVVAVPRPRPDILSCPILTPLGLGSTRSGLGRKC